MLHRLSYTALLTGLCLTLISPAGSAEDAAADQMQTLRARANAQLEDLAGMLTRELAYPGLRGQLRAALARSNHHEGSITVGRLIRAVRDSGRVPPGLQRLATVADQTRRSLNGRAGEGLADLDLYFPVDAHRKQWKGQADLIVAYTPLVGDNTIDALRAFSVKTGKRVALSVDEPPETPVLVISTEEHSTTEYPEQPANIEPLGPIQPDAVGRILDDQPVPQSPGNSYVGVRYINLAGKLENWWEGDPEIYLLFGQQRGNDCVARKLYLHEVNRIQTWYNLWNRSEPARWYFDRSYSGEMVLQVWEYDGGYRRTVLWGASNSSDFTCEWRRFSEDDHLNFGALNRANFNYDRNYWVTMPGGDDPGPFEIYIPASLGGGIEVRLGWRKEH